LTVESIDSIVPRLYRGLMPRCMANEETIGRVDRIRPSKLP